MKFPIFKIFKSSKVFFTVLLQWATIPVGVPADYDGLSELAGLVDHAGIDHKVHLMDSRRIHQMNADVRGVILAPGTCMVAH